MGRQKRGKTRRKHRVHPTTVPLPNLSNQDTRRRSLGGNAFLPSNDSPTRDAQAGSGIPSSSRATSPPPKRSSSPLRFAAKLVPRPVSSTVGGAVLNLEDDGYDVLLEGLEGADLRTAKLVVQALRSPEDLSRLRRLAVTHGFVNDRIRAVVWPRLLGITTPAGGGLALGQLPSHQPPSGPRVTVLLDAEEEMFGPTSPTSGGEPWTPSTLSPRASGGPGGHNSQSSLSPAASGALGRSAAPCDAFGGRSARGMKWQSPGGGNGPAESCPATPVQHRGAPAAPTHGSLPVEAHGRTGGRPLSPERMPRGRLEGTTRQEADWDGPISPAKPALEYSQGGAAGGRARGTAGELQNGGSGMPGGARGPVSWTSLSHARTELGGSSTRANGDLDRASDAYRVSAVDARPPWEEEGSPRDATAAVHSRTFNQNSRSNPGDASGVRATTSEVGGPHSAAWRRDDGVAPGSARCPNPGPGAEHGRGCTQPEWEQYLRWSRQPHRDSAVVEVDVARSLWSFTRDLGEDHREGRREQLKRLLNAVVAAHGGDVHYYQGLHDIASVLLMSIPVPLPRTPPSSKPLASPVAASVAPGTYPGPDGFEGATDAPAAPPPSPGELLAFSLLRRLATTHLRDATRPSLEPVVQLLGLVPYLVRAADPALARHMASVGIQPFFALSWFLTWWAHGLDDLPPASRLFDFFLSGHPLLPLYLGAVAMRTHRSALLACEEMPELHSALANLRLVDVAAAAATAATLTAAGSGVSGGAGPSLTATAAVSRVGAMGRRSGGHPTRAAVAAAEILQLEELLRQAEKLWIAKPPHTLLPLPSPSRTGIAAVLRRRRGGGGGGSSGGAGGRRTSSCGGPREDADEGGPPQPQLVLSACVAQAARLEGQGSLAHWRVPEEPPEDWVAAAAAAAGQGKGQGVVRGVLSRASSALGSKSRSSLLSTALLAGVYVAAAVAIGYATLTRNGVEPR